MPTYDFRCQTCSKVFDSFVKYEQRDELLDCPSCTIGKANRIPTVPMHMKASVPDGTKRPGFEQLRIENALLIAKSNANKQDRAEINKDLDAREKFNKSKTGS